MVDKRITDRIPLFIYFFCMAAAIAAGVIAINVFQGTRTYAVQTLVSQGRKLVTAFDHELNIQEIILEMVGAEAQNVIAGDEEPVKKTISDLEPANGPDGYTLRIPEGFTEQQIGNLTGLGAIPFPGSRKADEIAMALNLSALFKEIIENNPSLKWIYYTSESRFIYRYPRLSPDKFFYSDGLLERPAFSSIKPDNDAEKNLVWSPLSIDSVGTDLMVTLSKPVYDGDDFLGALSVDMSLSNLYWLLESSPSELATPYLVDSQGKKIIGLGDQSIDIDVRSLPPESIQQVGTRSFMVFPLHEVDWYIVYDINNTQMALMTLNSSAYIGWFFLFVIFFLAMILVVTHYMSSARYMAIHDGLTGVLNRRAFDEISLQELQKKGPAHALLGVCIVDIDFFKGYNDAYGHANGDDVIRRVANALKNGLRSPADNIYRVGGEEFAIVLVVNLYEDLSQILDRLIMGVNTLGIPHTASPLNQVTVSIGGVVAGLENIRQIEDLYKQADKALYQAKDSGRNRWVII